MDWHRAFAVEPFPVTILGARRPAAIGFQLLQHLGGYYLDQWLHTSPWFVLILGAMGVVAGFRELIRTLNRVNEEEDAQERAGRRDAQMRNGEPGPGADDKGFPDPRSDDRQADDDPGREKSE